jgi:rhodanese-related sulfurtransferase
MSFGIMKVKLSYIYLAGFVLVSLLIGAAYLYATSSPYRISSQEAKRRIDAGDVDLILDVRSDAELATLGSYPGSVHIQGPDLDKAMHVRYPDKNIRILSYCNTGHRARAATDKLHALGYKNAVFISSSYKTME